MELYRDISYLSTQSKEDQPSLTIANLIQDKYRSMPGITSDEMLQGYIPSPQIHLISPRQRQPRFTASTNLLIRPDYCDLCLTDHNTNSAWIRYNERRIEELQKRIDIMLQIDDNEEAHLLIPSRNLPITTTATVTQRIDDLLTTRSRYRSPLLYHHDRICKFFSMFFYKVKKENKKVLDYFQNNIITFFVFKYHLVDINIVYLID